jgi:NAD(P)-dependent dehydrogenase (short-subunit alcohol dehydrogenase family)
LEHADKVAVVTGASKDIGLAVAQELAGEGVLVVAGARSVAPLEGIENVTPFAVDLVDPDGPARLVAEAIERHGRIDVLVNNVGGVHLRLNGFLSTSGADFQASLEPHFFSQRWDCARLNVESRRRDVRDLAESTRAPHWGPS